MKTFWSQREPREKALIWIAAILLAALLAWQFAVKPLLAYPKAQNLSAQKAQSELQTAKRAAANIGSNVKTDKTVLTPEAAISQITMLAGEYNLQIARRQPSGDNGLTVWLDQADTRMLYGWIEALTSKYNINLVSANINKNADPSLRAQIVFEVSQ